MIAVIGYAGIHIRSFWVEGAVERATVGANFIYLVK